MTGRTMLAQRIDEIGRNMAACRRHCDGIHLDPDRGILPRALRLEEEGRSGNRGSVALGVNPGRGDAAEQSYYLQHGSTYDAMVAFWEEHRRFSHRYMIRTRGFIDAIGLDGPILWTELVKCQNPSGTKGTPPLSTLRACVHQYLMHEIAAVPLDWPIISLGREPHRISALMFPTRTIIGVPHPTGSFGHFLRLFNRIGSLKAKPRRRLDKALASELPAAIWLTAGM